MRFITLFEKPQAFRLQEFSALLGRGVLLRNLGGSYNFTTPDRCTMKNTIVKSGQKVQTHNLAGQTILFFISSYKPSNIGKGQVNGTDARQILLTFPKAIGSS